MQSRYLYCTSGERMLILLQTLDVLLEFIVLHVIHQMYYERSQKIRISTFSRSTTRSLSKTRCCIKIIPVLETRVCSSEESQQ